MLVVVFSHGVATTLPQLLQTSWFCLVFVTLKARYFHTTDVLLFFDINLSINVFEEADGIFPTIRTNLFVFYCECSHSSIAQFWLDRTKLLSQLASKPVTHRQRSCIWSGWRKLNNINFILQPFAISQSQCFKSHLQFDLD